MLGSTRNKLEDSDAKKEKNKDVELRMVSRIKYSASHYVPASQNYQQTTDSKRAAHTSMVEMAFLTYQPLHEQSSMVAPTMEVTGRLLQLTRVGQTL